MGNGRNRVGDIVLMWKERLIINILSFSINHIRGSVEEVSVNQKWYFDGIYGFSEEVNKRKTWMLVGEMVIRGGD